jgi:hypothetical protein
MMLMAGPERFGQEPLPGTRLVVATQQELQDAVGSESEAARIIKEILAGRLSAEAARTGGSPRVVSVVAEQLPETWLPTVDGVRIQRVPLAEARAGWERGCLSLLDVSVARTETTLTVTVREGHRCTSVGGDYLFDRRAQGWVARGGIGPGFGGGTSGCPCEAIR